MYFVGWNRYIFTKKNFAVKGETYIHICSNEVVNFFRESGFCNIL